MASLFRKTVTRPLPAGADIIDRKAGPVAVWKDRNGHKQTVPLVLDTEGKPKLGLDGKPRVRTQSRTVYAKVPGIGDAIPTGCRTEDAARYKLAELVKRAEHLKSGILTTAEARTADHQAAPLAEHFDAYGEHLRASGCTAAHRKNVRGRLRRLGAECGFAKLAELDRAELEKWLVAQEAADMSARTRNAYGAAAVSFANWCVESHRLSANPFAKLPKANERADPRRQRRAMTASELVALLDATQRRPLADFGREAIARPPAKRTAESEINPKRRNTWEAVPLTPDTLDAAEATGRERLTENPDFIAELERRGRNRALVYKLLTLTGLRANEARSLTVGSLDLNPANPYAVLAAADAKSREAAEIPLRTDLAVDLSRHLAERLKIAQRAAKRDSRPIPVRLPDDMPVLDVPSALVKILNRDMVAAGLARIERQNGKRRVAKRDNRGRSFDVHGFRHTFNSLLAAAGVSLRARQVLMRHATSGTLTDDVYSDAKLLDLRGALAKLPALPLKRPAEDTRERATGTDNGTPNQGPRLVALTVAPTAGNGRELLGSADKRAGAAAGTAAVSRIVASASGVKSNERPTSAVSRSHDSGRQDSNLRPSAPHAHPNARRKAQGPLVGQ